MTNATAPIWFAISLLVGLFGCSSGDAEEMARTPDSGGATTDPDAPDEATALLAFLEGKQYAGWAKEPGYHSSAGPHAEEVRVYYSPKAAAAITSGAANLPAGAAAVKELRNGGAFYGYAVWVKVQNASDGGNGFYWYEIIHRGAGKDSVYGDARGSTDCDRMS